MEFEKFIILLFSFVFLLFSEFSISGEELPENHRVQEEIKKMFAAGDKNKERGASPNIHSNVVIVTGEKRAASGVKTYSENFPSLSATPMSFLKSRIRKSRTCRDGLM